MSQVSDLPGVLDAAREAAGAGDHASAARLLRDALALQEASLGRRHPDLANTLNNLAVVCEQTGHVDEAEQFYRRAHAIAVASLRPGNPVIATSLRNLVEFCTARGIPLWRPPAATSDEETEAPVPTAIGSSEPFLPETAGAVPSEPSGTAPTVPAAPLMAGRSLVRRAAAVVTLVAGSLAVLLLFTASRPPAESVAAPVEVQPAPRAPEPVAAPDPPVIAGAATPDTAAPATPPVETTPRVAPTPAIPSPEANAAASPVTVVHAQVCSAFEMRGSPDWQCTPVSAASEPGAFVFYTRLRTGTDTTVEHRWYHNDRLHQTMRLRVGANAGSGFRTYSRSTIGAERAGSWKVEARTADGQLLHEEHFVVR